MSEPCCSAAAAGCDAAAQAAERLLAGLTGIVAVKRISREVVARVVELESRYGEAALIPVRNLGVRAVLDSALAFAALKDGQFRPPPAPTVYLVEEAVAGEVPERQRITVQGVSYRILGQELLGSSRPSGEATLFLAESFVLFPQRRSDPSISSYFLVPPLGFIELEEKQEELGIEQVVSVSPSTQSDLYLRQVCGFASGPSVATLLVGFNLRGRAVPRPAAQPA